MIESMSDTEILDLLEMCQVTIHDLRQKLLHQYVMNSPLNEEQAEALLKTRSPTLYPAIRVLDIFIRCLKERKTRQDSRT